MTVTLPAERQLFPLLRSDTFESTSKHTDTANAPEAPDGTAADTLTDRRAPAASAANGNRFSSTLLPPVGFHDTAPVEAPARRPPAFAGTNDTTSRPPVRSASAERTTKSAGLAFAFAATCAG